MSFKPFTALGAMLTAAVAVMTAVAFAESAAPKPRLPLQGQLVQLPRGPVLRVHGKDYALSTVRAWHFHTLRDKRLTNREIRVEGQWAADGTLQVTQFYTVKDGKLYRVRYFCEVCNIESLEPGDCVCCQAPTELQEIPVESK
jgi:hypothetical protein